MSQKCACGGKGRCLETRPRRAGVSRRYECLLCKARWNTLEIAASAGQGRRITAAPDAAIAERLRAVAAEVDALIARFS